MMPSSYQELFKIIGLIAAVVMPLWNIPLMMGIIRRRSSKDISLLWLFGIWSSIIFMLPSSLISPDLTLKLFGICNFVLFTLVVVVVMMYRKK